MYLEVAESTSHAFLPPVRVHTHACTHELTIWGEGYVNYLDLAHLCTMYIYVHQIITPHTLNTYNCICQFSSIKLGEKIKPEQLQCQNLFLPGESHSSESCWLMSQEPQSILILTGSEARLCRHIKESFSHSWDWGTNPECQFINFYQEKIHTGTWIVSLLEKQYFTPQHYCILFLPGKLEKRDWK